MSRTALDLRPGAARAAANAPRAPALDAKPYDTTSCRTSGRDSARRERNGPSSLAGHTEKIPARAAPDGPRAVPVRPGRQPVPSIAADSDGEEGPREVTAPKRSSLEEEHLLLFGALSLRPAPDLHPNHSPTPPPKKHRPPHRHPPLTHHPHHHRDSGITPDRHSHFRGQFWPPTHATGVIYLAEAAGRALDIRTRAREMAGGAKLPLSLWDLLRLQTHGHAKRIGNRRVTLGNPFRPFVTHPAKRVDKKGKSAAGDRQKGCWQQDRQGGRTIGGA